MRVLCLLFDHYELENGLEQDDERISKFLMMNWI